MICIGNGQTYSFRFILFFLSPKLLHLLSRGTTPAPVSTKVAIPQNCVATVVFPLTVSCQCWFHYTINEHYWLVYISTTTGLVAMTFGTESMVPTDVPYQLWWSPDFLSWAAFSPKCHCLSGLSNSLACLWPLSFTAVTFNSRLSKAQINSKATRQ